MVRSRTRRGRRVPRIGSSDVSRSPKSPVLPTATASRPKENSQFHLNLRAIRAYSAVVLAPTALSPQPAAARREPAAMVRTDGRLEETITFEAAMVGFFVDAADLMGVPKSVAAIYGICFASSEPLSFADIEQKLDLSAGSINQGVRFLREIGALKEVSTAAERVVRFEPDMELRKLASRWLDERLQKQLNSGQGRLAAIGKLVPAERNGSTKKLRGRLKALRDWHNRTQRLLPIVRTFLKIP